MENPNSVKLWDQPNSNTVPQLRRPRDSNKIETAKIDELPHNLNAVNSERRIDNNESANTAPKINSRLSADAAEFYPAGYTASTTVSTPSSVVQSRLKKYKQPDLSEPTQNDSFGNSQEHFNEDGTFVNQDVERLQHLINTLTYDPGQFDDTLELFMDTFKPYFDNITVISVMAKMIFQQAVKEQNFRYTAARLCCIVDHDCPLFRSELYLICNKVLSAKENIQGLTLFLAELYSQLHYENLYGKCLLDALNYLISTGEDLNVKCACQSLKLVGYSLGLYDSKALDDIFTKLNGLRASLSPSVANCLNSVIQLRNEGWGISNLPATNNSSQTSTVKDDNCWVEDDNTVFYNPVDGLELSADEKMFLADHLQPGYNIDDEELSDPDELCDPEPEMDEEIQAAFKEFLRLSKK